MSERTLSTKERTDKALVDAIAKSIRGPKKNSKDTK